MSHNTKRFNGVIVGSDCFLNDHHDTKAANTAGEGFFKGEELEVGLPDESLKRNGTPGGDGMT